MKLWKHLTLCCLICCCIGCVDPILSDLRSDDRKARANACVRLIADPDPSPRVVQALQVCTIDTDVEVRRLSIQALGKLGSQATEALPVVIEALTDPEETVQIAAAVAALQINATRTEPRAVVLSQIRLRNPQVIFAIGELGQSAKWAIPAIRELLSDREEVFRELAQVTLSQIQPDP